MHSATVQSLNWNFQRDSVSQNNTQELIDIMNNEKEHFTALITIEYSVRKL